MKNVLLLVVTTLTLLLVSCSTPGVKRETPTPVKAQAPALVNEDGVRLGIGTSRAEFEDFYGRTIDNDWMIHFRSEWITVVLKNDEIAFLGTTLSSGKRWSLENGIEVGTPIEQVRELLGKEDRNTPDGDTENMVNHHQLVYNFEDGSMLALNYFVDFGHGNIQTNTVAWFGLYAPNVGWIGTMNDDHSGTGDAQVSLISLVTPETIYGITHESSIEVYLDTERSTIFDGNTRVKDTFDPGIEYEILSMEGAGQHDAQILENIGGECVNGVLRVVTEGAWRIVVRVPSLPFPETPASD
ncbi:MAG: hypothetical protein FWF83_05860 [Clostridiales bacterium]|nr:hypothetical protein [Clostridiales bacterium]